MRNTGFRRIVTIVTLAVVPVAPLPAAAQPAPSSPSSSPAIIGEVQLFGEEDVKIEAATKTSIPLSKAPGAVTVITARQIRESGARTIPELLRLVGLESFERAHAYELSGGMQQRTALCRVLMGDPGVILMDEPFGALDEFTRERLNVELLRIWETTGKTIVFVTHNIGEAVFLSSKVVVMGTNPGRILRIVPIDLERPRSYGAMRERAYSDRVFEIRELLGVVLPTVPLLLDQLRRPDHRAFLPESEPVTGHSCGSVTTRAAPATPDEAGQPFSRWRWRTQGRKLQVATCDGCAGPRCVTVRSQRRRHAGDCHGRG